MKNHLYSYCVMMFLSASSFNLLAAPSFNGGDGSKEQPYSIVSAQQLDDIRNYLGITSKNMYFRLDADIDLASFNGGYWQPIGNGNAENAFCGKFDGNSKKIYHLRIGKQGDFYQYSGLFGYISDGAEIRNVYLASGIITGCPSTTDNSYTGAIAGYVSSNDQNSCIIDSCISKIQVTGGSSVNRGAAYTGGICGAVFVGNGNIKIAACVNLGTVTGTNGTAGCFTGGICGQALASAFSLSADATSITASVDINSCENIGSVAGGAAYSSTSATGGICGYSSGFGSGYTNLQASGRVNIVSCVNSGIVSGSAESGLSNSYTGGICGYQSGFGSINGEGQINIATCINNEEIIGNDANESACQGGIAGFASGFASSSGSGALKISESYNYAVVTSVSGGNTTGGIVGNAKKSETSSSSVTFADNYWLKEDDMNNSLNGIGSQLSIDEFNHRNSFTDWLFGDTNEATWKIWEGNTPPYLFFQSAPINVTLGGQDELICSVLPGAAIDSVMIYIKNEQDYDVFTTLKGTELSSPISIQGVANGKTLRLISYQYNKIPSNPRSILITNSSTNLVKSPLKMDISVYPNPVEKGAEFYISGLEQASQYYLELFNASGSLVEKRKFEESDIRFLAPAATGMYILKITKETGEKNFLKLIVK